MSNKPKLIISNMYRARNRSSFFAIHQAITKLDMFDIDFHILWDDPTYEDVWSDKLKKLNVNLTSYTKEDLNQYCRELSISEDLINKFQKFKAIYFIIHAHLLRHKHKLDYYLIYDDDIILTDGLHELVDCLANQIPCLICEPMNQSCDKVMANTLFQLYDNGFEYYKTLNPNFLGFNAGFQGIRLEAYDDFESSEMFTFLLNLFDYRGIYDENGKEIKMTPAERGAIDTQQQSFFGIMNIIRSKVPCHILNPAEYFVCPNWGNHPIYGELNPLNEYDGWDVNMKSKVIHFIGHTVLDDVYYGKPKIFDKLVNEYLKSYNYE